MHFGTMKTENQGKQIIQKPYEVQASVKNNKFNQNRLNDYIKDKFEFFLSSYLLKENLLELTQDPSQSNMISQEPYYNIATKMIVN